MPPNDNANLILYEHRNKKLPLAILIHHNFFFSLIYAVLVGVSSFKKWRDFNSTDSLNSSLLLPVYWTWVVVEASRLYSGQKGVLLDKVPELTAFFLLSFFPQSFIVLYMGFLQESILVWDRWMNVIMVAALFMEVGLTLRLLRSMSTNKTDSYS
mmetsp:Transcript_28316/g.42680  ORF Transcript_28316/g.42680 Transcript_28316/m.42680 type:complete len:155 (+) Transcript_28316:169-633(+)